MKKLELIKIPHDVKIGDKCGDIEPNIIEDTLFMADGEVVGFYIKELTGKVKQFAEVLLKFHLARTVSVCFGYNEVGNHRTMKVLK